MSTGETRELNTGIVIAGAYDDKVRRTLYAQLSSMVKASKDFAKEVARASGELNKLLYHILIEELKTEKGDAVRVRVKYIVDEKESRIKWLYDTLKVEVFKRIPDENVEKAVSKVLSEKLSEVQEQYKEAPGRVEAVEAPGKAEAVPPPTEEAKPGFNILDQVGSVDVVGETIDGGYILKFSDIKEESMGLASVVASGEDVVIDAILLGPGREAYRYITRVKGRLDQYAESPSRILEDLRGVKPTILSGDEARKLIEEKMRSLL